MSTLTARSASLAVGDRVDLFQIDLNPLGYNVKYYFTPSRSDGATIVFGGITYNGVGISASGFQRSGEEAPPEPKLIINNVDKSGYALLAQYDELLGAKVTRLVTMVEFLDKNPYTGATNPTADANSHFLPEIWYVEQKTNATRLFIELSLRAITDIRDRRVPNRLILKRLCTRPYRVWDAANGVFKYPAANGCPYTGTSYFKSDGTTTVDPAQDAAGKGLHNCCLLRFPNTDLPTWAFPGVSRISR